MGCPTEVEIGANLVFSVTTHDPDTGVLTDADAVPTYRIYEDETATPILTGSMAKLDDANTTGFYTELIACTSGNGFENGKTYTVYIEATVDSDKGGMSYSFKAYDHRKSNLQQWLGTAAATPTVAGVPEVDLTHLMGTILSEGGAGRLAAAFIKLFDVSSPLLVASDVMRGTDSAGTAAKLLAYIQLLARSDAAIETDNSTELTEINADEGSGGGDFSSQTDSEEAIRARGDAAWDTATGFSTLTAQNVRDAMKLGPTGNSPAAGSVDKHLDDIVEDTGEIGAAGAGLSDLGGMSTAMKAEVQSEAEDAIVAKHLDHFIAASDSVGDTVLFAGIFETGLTDPTDYWENQVIVFTAGDLAGLSRRISSYAYNAPANSVISVTPAFPAAPGAGDSFVIMAGVAADIEAAVDDAHNNAIPGSPTADSINERIKALDDLISSSKLPAQIKGADADTIDASALATDAVTEIRDAIAAHTIDGTIDLEECLKILLAVLAGDIAKSTNTYTFDEQDGSVKVTEVLSTDAAERTIA